WDTGFKFSQFQAKALLFAMRRAVDLYHKPDEFRFMVKAGMSEDFSWDNSAREYIRLFQQVLHEHP
ncbi:MAG: glycogen synthase, partial [Candidatus Adiutrix sp.]